MDSDWRCDWERALSGLVKVALGGEAGGGIPQTDEDEASELLAINRAFLMMLGGGRAASAAAAALRARAELETPPGRLARLYDRGQVIAAEEAAREARETPGFRSRVASLGAALAERGPDPHGDLIERCWDVFFPEGTGISGRVDEAAAALRQRRTVRVTAPARRPLVEPSREVLFTSNALLTVPLNDDQRARLPADVRRRVEAASAERQRFWYDHPMPVGASTRENEVLYGLRGLDEAVRFEKDRGSAPAGAETTVLLSVSVTHEGLRTVAREYLAAELTRAAPLRHLRVVLLTETETRQLIDGVLAPAAERLLGRRESEALHAVFGVDGEYGRHYTFLKAVAPLYGLLADACIRATFKIDLDQVFPQAELVRETGLSAFDRLRTPLWGCRGVDWQGRPVELGMIAGALVNDRDIGRSLFTPDVPFPDRPPVADELVFWSPVTQALSTRAEMMARYGGDLDGVTRCLQRVHVTGGTNGILFDSLRRQRPFTPTFIGRAEDQAYLLSVLKGDGPVLGYLHQPGLVMRHDKESFASGAIEAAATGKLVGDYARQLLFSGYARALPWPIETIKERVDPFTGCFISRLPVTVVCLRLALRGAWLARTGQRAAAAHLLALAAERLWPLVAEGAPRDLARRVREERLAWDLYYDTLDALETGLKRGDSRVMALAERGRAIFADALVERPRR